MTRLALGLVFLVGLAAASPASAEEGRRLLVLGEATTPPPEGMPARFVVDAMLEAGDDPFKTDFDEGWLATLGDSPQGDDIEGACVEARCAMTAELGYNKLAISADLAGPGAPGAGRMVLTDSDGKKVGEAQVRFTAITGPVEGLGAIAPLDAVRSLELSDLLMWNGASPPFSNAGDEPIDWLQRSAVADWQAGAGRQGAGLILVDDLALLRREAAATKTKLGWTLIEGSGWKAGYPAALLPIAETVGNERRFASADGKLRLVISVEPPMSDEAWDAYVDEVTEDREGIARRGYTRVNDDMEITWIEKGRYTAAAYHNRDKGLVRLEFSRPESGDDEVVGGPDLDTIMPRSLRADEDE